MVVAGGILWASLTESGDKVCCVWAAVSWDLVVVMSGFWTKIGATRSDFALLKTFGIVGWAFPGGKGAAKPIGYLPHLTLPG